MSATERTGRPHLTNAEVIEDHMDMSDGNEEYDEKCPCPWHRLWREGRDWRKLPAPSLVPSSWTRPAPEAPSDE